MNRPYKTLVFTIFCHETKELTISTTLECLSALNYAASNLHLGFIFIDDGSSDNETSHAIQESILLLRRNSRVLIAEKIYHPARLGLAESMFSSLNLLQKMGFIEDVWLTQIPGNDQVNSKSLQIFLEEPLNLGLKILWRANPVNRPPIKRFASHILQVIVRFILFPEIKQSTANFIAPVSFYSRWLKPTSGHAYGLWLIAGAIIENISISQISFKIKKQTIDKHKAQRRTPKFSDIFSILLQLYRIRIFMNKNLE
jgi:hypothetical protein